MATANVLSYAEIFQAGLDLQFMQESTTAWMEANASQVRYSGGNKIQIPKVSVEGLGTYSRSSGFPDGAVTLSWEERTLTQDRGKEFNLDAQDYDETSFVAGAGTILGEFQRTKVVPEVDAYRYSTIFSLANQQLKTGAYTPAVATVYSQLKADIEAIQDVIGETEPLVIAISHATALVLDKSTEIEKHIGLDTFENGALKTKTKTLDGIPMFRVPSARLKSAFTFSATNGFTAAATAMNINWIIAARSAIIAVVKTDKVRVFAPDQNQNMDAWKIQYRKYHDLWIKDNAFDSIYVSYTSIAAPALTATVAAGTAAGTKFTASVASGHTLAYLLQAGEITDPKFNDIPTGLTAYTSGTDIAAAVATNHLGMYELDATGHVVKFTEATLASGDIHA
jgi:hypothetical protein